MSEKLTPLMYIKRELNFSFAEWKELTEKDKIDLRAWAEEEMGVLGV